MDLLYICTTGFEKDNKTPISGMQFCTMLKRGGIACHIVDFDYLFSSGQLTLSNVLKYDLETMIDYIIERKPRIVCFDSNCKHYPFTILLAKALKMSHKSVKIVFTGPQAVLTAKETLTHYHFINLILMDISDPNTPKIMRALLSNDKALSRMTTIAYRERGRVIIRERDSIIESGQGLESINYNMMDQHYYKDTIEIEAGPGCYHNCSFCRSKNYGQKIHAQRTGAAIVAEIQYLHENYKIKHFIIKDALFTLDKKRLIMFCQLLVALHLPVTWECRTQIDVLDDSMIHLMSESGCTGIQMAVETGSKKIEQAGDKPIQVSDVLSISKRLSNHNISVSLFFMYGYCDESQEDLRATLNLISTIIEQNLAKVKMYKMPVIPKSDDYNRLYHKLYFDYERPPSTVNGIKYNYDMAPLIRENKAIYSFFYDFDNKVRQEYTFLDIFVDIMGFAMQHYHKTGQLILNTYQGDWLHLYKDVFSVLNDMVHELYLARFYDQSDNETIFRRNFSRIVDSLSHQQANGRLIRTLFEAEK